MQPETEKTSFQKFWSETRWVIITFLVLCVVSLPCCFFIGFRTNWILWQLGLR